MKKTLVVAMFVTAMAIITMPLPSFADNVGYNATVAVGQSTSVVASNGSFGTILAGYSKIINNSVTLNNTGDVNATVSARFNDSRSGVYGLVSGINVIGAGNFSLAKSPSGSWTALNNSGGNVQIAIAAGYGAITILDAKLSVPTNQTTGAYNGTVILTFGDQV